MVRCRTGTRKQSPTWDHAMMTHFELSDAHHTLMVEAVRDATVLTATEADVDDYTYFPVFHNLRTRRDHYDVATARPLDDKAREILDAIDAFTRTSRTMGRGVFRPAKW